MSPKPSVKEEADQQQIQGEKELLIGESLACIQWQQQRSRDKKEGDQQ